MSKNHLMLEDAETLAQNLVSEFEVFFSDKRTKAGSRRIRSILGTLKKHTPELRRKLIEADEQTK